MVGEELFSGFVLPLPLAVFLLGGLLFPIFGVLSDKMKFSVFKGAWMVLTSAGALVSVYLLYMQVKASADEILLMGVWSQRPPLAGCFEIDMLSVFMAGSISVLGLLVAVYSISYMEKESRLTEFYTLMAFMMAGMMGVVMAGDMFTLFVFWELMGLSSYVLVAFQKRTWGPIEAGFKYLVMSATAGAFLLLGMSILYGMTGTLNFAALAASLKGVQVTPWMMFLFGCLIVGFGVKSAIVPLHTWLPDAHPEAPSPISALLSGIVIETGLYALIRVLFLVFEPGFFTWPIAILAIITMSLGNLMALLQNDLKRLLAYSSIAQIGYMLIGVSAGTTYGITGVSLHIFNHSFLKGMAFLSAGSIVHEADTRNIESLKGIGKFMPLTSTCLFVTLLGLGGVPGTNGFISKFILFNSAIGEGMTWLAIIGVLNSVLSMGYYLRVMKTLISEPIDSLKGLKEAPPMMLGVTVVMMVFIVLFGLWPEPVIGHASAAATALIDNLPKYIGRILP